MDRLLGQRVESDRLKCKESLVDEERLGKATRCKAIAGTIGKAIKGLVGGVQEGSADERRKWTHDLIPRSGQQHEALSSAE